MGGVSIERKMLSVTAATMDERGPNISNVYYSSNENDDSNEI